MIVLVFIAVAALAGYTAAAAFGAAIGWAVGISLTIVMLALADRSGRQRTKRVMAAVMPRWHSELRSVLDDPVPYRHGRVVWDASGLYSNGISGLAAGRPVSWWITSAEENGRVSVKAAVQLTHPVSLSIHRGAGAAMPEWPTGVVLAGSDELAAADLQAINHIDPQHLQHLFSSLGAREVLTIRDNWLVYTQRGQQPMGVAVDRADGVLHELCAIADDLEAAVVDQHTDDDALVAQR